MTVHVACGAIESVLAAAPLADSWLTDSERARLAVLVTGKRRSQFLAARWQARWLLAQALGGLPQEWPLEAPSDAPPRVAGRAELFLSISHSGHLTAAAWGTAPLGLDLEAPRPGRDIDGLVALCCTPDERVRVDGEAAFHELWTVKEAWLKRHGEWLAPRRLQQLQAARESGGEVRTWAGTGWNLALCSREERLRWWGEKPRDLHRWRVTDLSAPA